VLTIATSVGNEPWCANCFYVYLEEENALVLPPILIPVTAKSLLKIHWLPDRLCLRQWFIGKIRGIQFQGIVSEPEGEMLSKAKWAYLKKFPPAALMDTHLWS